MLDVPFLGLFVALMFVYSVPLSMVALALLGLLVVVSVAVAPLLQRGFNEQFLLVRATRPSSPNTSPASKP